MTTAQTRSGSVRGTDADGIHAFKGIPYAEAPVGDRRWAPPTPEQSWSDERDATAFGPIPHQNEIGFASIIRALRMDEPQSEDCLYLNVWTPGVDDAKRPVMVWIHGGGFVAGSGSQAWYDGSALARSGDVVVVTINYRLGAFGWLDLASVTDGAIPATGNTGLLDQIAALEWVRDSIAGFGGDPANVTISGESAGGMSVGSLLGAPAARGLIHKAILQSGTGMVAQSRETAAETARRFCEALGTSDPADLLAATPEQILEVARPIELKGMPLCPTIDGDVLPQPPLDVVATGGTSDIPLLVGTTQDEATLFFRPSRRMQAIDEDGLRKLVRHTVPDVDPEEIIAPYRAARPDATPADVFTAISRDRILHVPGIRTMEAQLAHADNVHAYVVTWPSPLDGGAYGAVHTVELAFLFGTHTHPDLVELSGSGPDANRFADVMQACWSSFARSGDPSNDLVGDWPGYDTDRRATMMLGETCQVVDDPASPERLIWEDVEASSLGSF